MQLKQLLIHFARKKRVSKMTVLTNIKAEQDKIKENIENFEKMIADIDKKLNTRYFS